MIGEYRVLEKGPGLLAPFPLLYFRVFVCSFRSLIRSFGRLLATNKRREGGREQRREGGDHDFRSSIIAEKPTVLFSFCFRASRNVESPHVVVVLLC